MPRQKQNNLKIILGLTGSFGSGKSTVARMFRGYGARVIDADSLAHQFIRPGTNGYNKIIAFFGRGILKKNKDIDRRKLAAVVFNDKRALKKLNGIIHPGVIKCIKDEIRNSRERIIVLDAPLLIEAGLERMVDKLIVVKLERKLQVRRIREKTSLKKTDILKRIECQIPLSQKVRLADFIIDNNGTIKETKKQVALIRRKLWRS
ncbi:MAG: dephospho-CoA kinase [Candidatus Omnitrophica bacterium]|nr:dephospho-CoA kinase [Candidatus Omnitrophota bacterium]